MPSAVTIPLIINDNGSVTLGKIADGLDNVGKKAKQAQGIMGEFGAKLTSGLGIGAGFALGAKAADMLLGAIRSIPAEFSRIVEAGGKLSDLAAKTGMTTTALQELGYAGSLVGVSLETATGAVTRMQKALVDTPDKFQALGLSAQELINLDPAAAFGEIAEQIAAIPNPAERAAAAMRLFGKSGADLLPLITSMQTAKAEAALLGTTISEDQVRSLDSMGDATTRAGASWDALKGRLTAATIEALGLDKAMDGLAVTVGQVNRGADENASGWEKFAASAGEFLLYANPIVVALAGINSALGRQSAALYEVAAAEKAAAASRSGSIFNSTMTMPGPQGGSALDLLNDQLRESQVETKKLTTEHERAAAAALKQAEAEQAIVFALESAQAGINLRLSSSGFMQPGMPDDRVKLGALSGNTDPNAYSQESANKRLQEQKDYAEGIARAGSETTESTLKWNDALQQVSNQFAQLASSGGPLSGMLGMLADAGNLTAGIGSSLDSFNKGKKDGGFGGFLGQASGVIGIAGAAFGFVSGLFNRGKKKREEEKKRKEQLLKESEDQLKSLVDQWDQARRQFVDAGASGVGAMFQSIADGAQGSAERMARLGRMGGVALSLLRKEGLSTVEAMKQLGPTIDAAIAAAQKSGHKLTGPLAEMADLKKKVDKNQSTVNAADGFNDYLAMLRSQGMLTQEVMGDVTAELADQMADLGKAGFTTSQQLTIMAPALFQLAEAEKAGKVHLDATTEAMIEQAKAQGLFDGMVDPMAQLVQIQQQMLLVTAALAEAFGATLPESVRKYIDELNQIPAIPGPPGAAPTPGTTTPPPGSEGKVPGHANGGIVRTTGLAMLHGTPAKPEYIFNHDQMMRVLAGRGGGIGGGRQGGATVTIGSIHSNASDPRQVAAEVVRQIEARTNPRLNTAIREAR